MTKDKRRRSRLTVPSRTAMLVLAVIGLATAVTIARPPESSASGPPLLSLPFAALNCDTHCDHCPNTAEHHNHAAAGGGNTGMLHAACIPAGCSPVHDCNPEFGAAWEAIQGADRAGLVRIAGEHPNFVRLSVDRTAIQVLDCSQEIFAHVPLGAVQRTLSED